MTSMKSTLVVAAIATIGSVQGRLMEHQANVQFNKAHNLDALSQAITNQRINQLQSTDDAIPPISSTCNDYTTTPGTYYQIQSTFCNDTFTTGLAQSPQPVCLTALTPANPIPGQPGGGVYFTDCALGTIVDNALGLQLFTFTASGQIQNQLINTLFGEDYCLTSSGTRSSNTLTFQPCLADTTNPTQNGYGIVNYGSATSGGAPVPGATIIYANPLNPACLAADNTNAAATPYSCTLEFAGSCSASDYASPSALTGTPSSPGPEALELFYTYSFLTTSGYTGSTTYPVSSTASPPQAFADDFSDQDDGSIARDDNFFYFCASTAAPPACVTAETQVMTAELNGVSVNELQAGDAILAATGDITTVSYISKHTVAAHTPVYQVNKNGPYITAQHPVELVGSDNNCEHTYGMIDAAGWVGKSNDYVDGCVVELSASHTIIQYIDGVATYITVKSIDQYALSDVSSETVVYNVYTAGGHNIIADGMVLGEPSKQHMKAQYGDMSAINVNNEITINSVDMIVPINHNIVNIAISAQS